MMKLLSNIAFKCNLRHYTTVKTQWQHPMEEYYKGVVFMRKVGRCSLTVAT